MIKIINYISACYENYNYLLDENINIFIEISSDYKQFDND